MELMRRINETSDWIMEVELLLTRRRFVRHFRGESDGATTELEAVIDAYADGAEDPLKAISSFSGVGTQRFNEFIDMRRQRLGEILFSLPGPNSKVARLG
jgi:hypothetical protein